ncbi:MAG: FAD:protein FMN transferase [Candidatus Omnitrophica bacterium]|nr:FAD:protein FMN transferase [Candidatus Omnitrophota bacterium]
MRTMTMAQWLKTVLLWIVVTIIAVCVARALSGRETRVQKETRFMMDTYVTVSAAGPEKVAAPAVKAALDRMQEVAIKFNGLDARSPIYAFNHDGTPIKDKEILGLIQTGLDMSAKTDGAFDMTVEALAQIWGFHTDHPHLPADADIQRALKSVGYAHLSLKDGQLEKDAHDVMIDLGGIAKGYSIVEAVKVLKAHGIVSALIDAGGDVYVIGQNASRPWNIGIQQPRGDGIVGYVAVTDTAVMGSGDYQRFFIKDGKRYHHIFNPRTGYPTEGVVSVTVIYPDPVVGQVLGKIPFIMGPEKGLAFLEKIPGMDVIVILSSGEKIVSKGIRHPLKTLN